MLFLFKRKKTPRSTPFFSPLFLLLILVLLVFPPPAPAQGLKKVRLIPDWLPQAQFAGFMVALEKGFYREAGLEVEIITGGPGRLPFDLLESRRADFGVIWLSSAIVRRSRGLKIVNLAQVAQRSSLLLVAKKQSGIRTPGDLRGKKVGLWAGDFRGTPSVFLKKLGLAVEVIPQYYSINLFIRDGVAAAAAMYYNEYDQIIQSGLNPDELTLFFLKDFGVDFPEDGLYCLESTYDQDPEMCERFAQATMKGWRSAAQNKKETLDLVLENMAGSTIGANRAHQSWMLDRFLEAVFIPGDDQPGRLKAEDYARTAQQLREYGLIENIPPFEDFQGGRP
ncbi:MAG: ABC transporter substrate-binding protein [Pseudomonadota bacterium]